MFSLSCTYESYTEKVATASRLFINIFPNEECHCVKVSFTALNWTASDINWVVFQQLKIFKAFLMVSLRKSPVTKSSSVVWIAFLEFHTKIEMELPLQTRWNSFLGVFFSIFVFWHYCTGRKFGEYHWCYRQKALKIFKNQRSKFKRIMAQKKQVNKDNLPDVFLFILGADSK